MYLKSIEIHGFKSFANKIDFQFHNGITGIVGPNGSGKSNVADAVRWVLGEQSAKQLRGASMQDVIFSGTESRKPQGCAFVAITLDNSDHQLGIDYEEVTVARRVYRSGESEYLINGTPCRLKDINELFYDTGIGKEGYSIIGQGQIDRILSGKPEDRRELFDEAAGIVKFKRRKAAATKKLSDEEGNLVRVNDILGELEKQVGPLEKQSEKAKVYLKKREVLQKLDINAFLLETEQLQGQLDSAEDKVGIASGDLNDTLEAYEKSKEDSDRVQEELAALDEELEKVRGEISQSEITREKLLGQIDVLKVKIQSAQQSDEHFRERKNTLKLAIDEKNKELKAVNKAKKEIDEDTAEAVERRNDAKESLAAIADSISHLQSSIDKGQQSIVDALSARTGINTRMGQCDAMMEQIDIKKAELNSRILQAKSDEVAIAEQKAEYEKAFKAVCEEIRILDEKIAEKELKAGQLSDQIHEKEAELAACQTKFHEANSKLEALRNMAERYEGYGNSVRRVMEKKDKRVCGVVADIFTTEKKYEVAIETALGGNIQNIVTEDEQTAKDMIRFLKENKLGRATFLPLTSVREREFNAPDALNGKGVIGLADTLVKVDRKYSTVASNLLHNYIVVDTVDNALALARKFNFTLRIVTLGGEALNPGGSISGGSYRSNSNLLGRSREMEELEKLAKKTREDIDKLNAEIDKLRDERTAVRGEASALHEEEQNKFIEQNTAKMNLNQAVLRQEEAKQGYKALHTEESDIALQAAEIESQKKQIAKELESSERTEADSQKKIETQTKLLEDRKKREAELLSSLSELDIKAAELIQKQEFEQVNVERIEGEKKKLEEEMAQIEESLGRATDEVSNRQEEIAAIEETIKACDDAGKQAKEKLSDKLGVKDELTDRQREYFARREALSDRKSNLDKEVFRLNSQIGRLKEITNGKYNYMWTEYEITMSQAREMRDPELTDLPEMKAQIKDIKAEIKSLGDVNVNAIEQYREVMERYEFLRTQHDDLVAAKEALEKVIEELDEGMRTQFTEKFSEIAVQFDKVFKELFGGGKGTLELMEDEDILEAGIRIIAQPPGKKLQNMMQLSGGEKALAAIALLFAIQNMKPSPFCLLDEIEAALDESNVGRFAGYLKKLTRGTQFIVITHRRGTMEKADRLYGITMQEKGVSALVSVNLIDEKDLK